MDPSPPTPGTTVNPLNLVSGCVVDFQGSKGTIRFIGKTQFATGTWIGIELHEGEGKNDGSVGGVRYFQCAEGRGVFCRVSQVKNVISYPASSSASGTASSGRRSSIAPSATSASSRRASLAPGESGRLSLASRPPSGVAGNTRSSSARVAAGRPPIASKAVVAPVSADIPVSGPAASVSIATEKEEVVKPVETSPPPAQPEDRRESMIMPATPSLQRAAVSVREHEELKVRVKLLESKRTEDRDKLREYERLKAEMETTLLAKSRSASKVDDLQAELVQLRKQVKESQKALEEVHAKYVDACDSLEMVTLDKEVAEERADSLQGEVDILQERVDELSLDIEVLQEERKSGQDGTGEGGAETGPLAGVEQVQLVKQNERLKEALIKLRDVSTTREAELEKQIRVLSKDQTLLTSVQTANEDLKSNLATAEEHMEILKQQLDDALENNDLVELLTVKNLKLSEQVDEQRESLADLEALRDLNEELDENHQETEQELMEEIAVRELEIRELKTEIERVNEANADYGNTVLQFRELVKNLQSDLVQLKGHSDGQDREVLASQSQHMLELNMKLQNTAMKNTATAIELDLRRMQARQTLEELEVVKKFVPKLFFEQDAAALKVYFGIYRLSFKSELIVRFVDDSIRRRADGKISDETYVMGLIRYRACQIAYVCAKLMIYSRRCRMADFVLLHHYVQDLELAESKIDELVVSLKAEELRSPTHLITIKRIVSQLFHISEKVVKDETIVIGDQVGSHAGKLFDAAAQIVISGSAQLSEVYHHAKEDSLQVEIEKIFSKGFHENINELLVESRMIGKKIDNRLSELTESDVLKPDQFVELETLLETVDKFSSFYQALNENIIQYLQSKESPVLADITGIMQSAVEDYFGAANAKVGLACVKTQLLVFNESLNALYEQSLDPSLSCIKMPTKFTEPWTLRAKEILEMCQNNPELERQYADAQQEVKKLASDIKTKEESYNQAHIKVQILEKRIEALRQQSSVVDHYEVELKKMKEQEKTYMEAIESMQSEIDRLETEMKQALEKEKQQHDGKALDDFNISDRRIAALYSAMRLLRAENDKLRAQKSNDILDKLQEDDHIFKRYLQTKSSYPANVKEVVQESKSIMKQAQLAAASIQLVDLTKSSKPSDKPNQWKPMSTRPEYQYRSQQTVMNTIKHRTMALETKIKSLHLQSAIDIHKPHTLETASNKRLVARVRVNNSNNGDTSESCRSVLLHSVPEFKKIHQRIIGN